MWDGCHWAEWDLLSPSHRSAQPFPPQNGDKPKISQKLADSQPKRPDGRFHFYINALLMSETLGKSDGKSWRFEIIFRFSLSRVSIEPLSMNGRVLGKQNLIYCINYGSSFNQKLGRYFTRKVEALRYNIIMERILTFRISTRAIKKRFLWSLFAFFSGIRIHKFENF